MEAERVREREGVSLWKLRSVREKPWELRSERKKDW